MKSNLRLKIAKNCLEGLEDVIQKYFHEVNKVAENAAQIGSRENTHAGCYDRLRFKRHTVHKLPSSSFVSSHTC